MQFWKRVWKPIWKLIDYLPVNFNDEEKDQYDSDVDRLSLLRRLPDVVDKDKKPVQPDIWWHEVFSKNDLTKLQEVISLGLSLFTGPIVEGTFSEVQNIVTDKRNCLQDRSVSVILSVILSVRSAVKADGRSLEAMFPVGPDASINPKMVRAIRYAYKTYNDRRRRERCQI